MAFTIPQAGGVPGISGPPNWFNAPPTGSFRLDDVEWRGAFKRTFGGGGSLSISLRALHRQVSGQEFIYLSFWAAFVQELADERDSVFFGLQAGAGGTAMVIHMEAHPSGPGHSGPPPDNNPPANLPASIETWTRAPAAASWTSFSPVPTWINANARAWIQEETHVAGDPNNRWAIQLRIPVSAAATITDNSGPNLGTSFMMWYYIRGSSGGSSVKLADSRIAGITSALDIVNNNFPAPSDWEQVDLAAGPATFGGIAINWGDVVVQNAAYGEGGTIDNGATNTFVARPRNYRSAGNDIPAGAINATFRIANWGSVAGVTDFTSGQWDYVLGNGPLSPVPSTLNIPTLAANANPPATTPIALPAVMNLPAGKSLHQCILVTLSGNNLIFLDESIYRNMNYDSASLLAREAEINIVDLAPFSPQPRDVYLAVEKVNMAASVPAGTDEGQFLARSMERLMVQGGPLSGKLRRARAILANGGDHGSAERLEALLVRLQTVLARLDYADPRGGQAALRELMAALRQWFLAVKQDPAAAKRLAALFDAAADWLEAGRLDALAKLATFVGQLNQWLSSLGNDPASSELLPAVVEVLRAWLATLANGQRLLGPVDVLARWIEAGRPVSQLPAVLNALRELLGSLSSGESDLAPHFAAFARGMTRWLRGGERLDSLVNVLADVGLTSEELDQLFPTIRIHPYYDTGERVTGADGVARPALSVQPAFGLYAYHEGGLEGWQTSLQGAQRIAENLYLLAVPNNGTAKVTVKVQGVEPGEGRIPEDPIVPIDRDERCGCLCQILKLFGINKKK